MLGNQSTQSWGWCQGATGSEEEVMREGQASRAQATGRTGQGQRLGELRDWEAGRAEGVLGRSGGFWKDRAGRLGGAEEPECRRGEREQSKEHG